MKNIHKFTFTFMFMLLSFTSLKAQKDYSLRTFTNFETGEFVFLLLDYSEGYDNTQYSFWYSSKGLDNIKSQTTEESIEDPGVMFEATLPNQDYVAFLFEQDDNLLSIVNMMNAAKRDFSSIDLFINPENKSQKVYADIEGMYYYQSNNEKSQVLMPLKREENTNGISISFDTEKLGLEIILYVEDGKDDIFKITDKKTQKNTVLRKIQVNDLK